MHLSAANNIELWSPAQAKETSLGNNGKMNILVFLSPECPMCINYTLTLSKMQKEYGQELQITGIIPGTAYSDQEILAFADSYSLSFPILTDKKKELSTKLQAEVTPEAYLFDRVGTLVYSGAIDNWLSLLGKKKAKPDKHYLSDAINQTLHGQLVTTPYAKAQGCAINDY